MDPFGGGPPLLPHLTPCGDGGRLARFQLQFMLGIAEGKLQQGQLINALHDFRTAQNHCNLCRPVLEDQVPHILSRCSFLSLQLGDYAAALNDAQECIARDQGWAEGYLRAALAFRRMNDQYNALENLINGYNLTIHQPGANQYCKRDILTETILLLTQIDRHNEDCASLLASQDLDPGSPEEQSVLLKILADRRCWEGVSLLVTGVHTGIKSSLDFSSPNCPARDISVGILLKDLSDNELKRNGIQLAVALLKNGARFSDIEIIWKSPVVHVVILKTLETGRDELLELMFKKYLDSQEKRNAVDFDGNTILHVIVQYKSCAAERKNALIDLCIRNGCSPFIFDQNEKLAIEYCTQDDMCHQTLSKTMTNADKILSSINELKEKGNTAKGNKSFEEALNQYNRALKLSENGLNLGRERAILHTNKCAVLTEMNSLQDALESAERAIENDSTWSKGHWRKAQLLRKMERFSESFHASLTGHNLTDVSKDIRIKILMEGIHSFQNISESDKRDQYEKLSCVSVDLWPLLLENLSKKGEWLCIKELVLGMENINVSEAKGVAKDVDFSRISYSTIIPFMVSDQKLDRKAVGAWLIPLIVHMTKLSKENCHPNVFKFKEHDADTPLHIAARLSVITENATLMKYMVEVSKQIGLTDGIGNSPLHSIINMPRPPETDAFLEVVEDLLRTGVSPQISDRHGKRAIDYVDQTKEPQTFLLLTNWKTSDIDTEIEEKSTKQKSTIEPKSKEEDPEIMNDHLSSNDNGGKKRETESSSNATFKTKKSAGDKAFKAREYEKALVFYEQAKERMEKAKNADIMHLFCNIADCLNSLKRYQDILKSAEQFQGISEYTQVQFRIGKAYMGLKKFKKAFSALARACHLSPKAENEDILYEIAKCCVMGDVEYWKLADVKRYRNWLKILLKLIHNDDWETARLFYSVLNEWVQDFEYYEYHESFDLKPLCNINKMQQHRWVSDLIHELLMNGSDIHTLLIEKGEPFLHACIRVTYATGNTRLFKFALQQVQPTELNIQDSHDNSALHLAVDTRVVGSINPDLQMFIVKKLYVAGVNPLILNKKKKLPSKCVSRKFQEIAEYMKQQEEKSQQIRREQQKQIRQLEDIRRKSQQEEKRRQQEDREREKKIRIENRKAKCMEDECLLSCALSVKNARENLRLKEIRLASYDLIHVFQTTKHRSDKHKQFENEALTLIIDAFGQDENPDIPERLTRIPMKTYRRIVRGLAEKEHWKQMHIAVMEYRKHRSNTGLHDFAEGLSVMKVIKCDQLQQSKDLIATIIDNMLKSGATLPEGGKQAVELAVQTNNFKALIRLFDHGADPVYLSVESGDTPIHAALQIALERDKGNTSLLEMFLENRTTSPCLDPSQLNLLGESLFHVVAKSKYSDTTYEVTRVLCEKGVKSNIRDSDGKLPVDYLKNKDDRRLQYFRLAAREGKENVDTIDRSTESDSSQIGSNTSKNDTKVLKKQMDKPAPVAQIKKQKLREEIIDKIRDLKDISMYSDELMSKSRKKKNSHTSESSTSSVNKMGNEKENLETKFAERYTQEKLGMKEKRIEMETKDFDNSEWEIECTSDVWGKLMASKLTFSVLKDVIETLQEFAKGIFTSCICEAIDPGDLFKTIEIFESGPLLWEIAVCFSPRLTGAEERSSNVYTETVRIWDIVKNAKEKEDSLKKIKESYLRGSECMIEKYITCSDKLNASCFGGKQRLPRKYIECSRSDIHIKNAQKLIFPASHLATEYHILKFYSFTTEMAKCTLQSADNSKDFPFKVTEVEHSIINLCSTSPILLLGRSGTGKTTCCLYRLCHRYNTCSGVIEREFHEEEDEIPIDSPPHNIRQLFVTKNLVLCNEVQKTFCEIRNATRCKSMDKTGEKAVPEKFDDFKNDEFPVFLTSKKLLLMIDGSLPNPFFKRDSSGKLLDDVPGWSNDDDSLSILPKLDDYSDTESELSDDETYFDEMDDTNTQPRKSCVRREVTYDIFANLVWPKIRKGFEDYHPSLVWMEIISFIKGSYESLVQTSGCLSRDDYIEQGQKKAPNFTGKREQIYDIFLKYRHFTRQRFWFDEADVVNDIFHRIRREKIDSWNIQEIYVDETQDFTQAELYLLLRICKNPNNMFLTGDTAQSIMRGISFRFKDLRSLFYHANQRVKDVNIPEKIHQLTHNYRSHTGVLYLASSVLDLLVEFFPESFDILQSDQGLFNGPSPVLLEICERSDLAVLLKGKGKSTSRIEFGARQAVLVANDVARENLPDALRQGIVLTIYEAKGLEFDDILLYNFFKESQAKKEWRVVTQLLEKWHNQTSNETKLDSAGKCKNLVEIDYNVLMESNRPRPLAFDPIKHKVLNTELKQLYTAITRARVNVWIFDESEETRAPMFEYFKARKLVQTVKDSETGGNLGFAEVSTPEEWILSGEKFMAKSLFNTAATCFREGGNHYMENIAKCHQKALEASRMHDAPTMMRELFLSAAHDFLEYEKPLEAGKCLENAKEWNLAANLYKKTNQLVKASEIYIKMRLPLDGSKCLEEAGQFKKAIKLLCDHGFFEAAIDCLHRYQILLKEYKDKGKPIPWKLTENAPDACHSEEKLSLLAAKIFLQQGQIKKMKTFLDRLPDIMDRVDFLIENDRIEDTIAILKSFGKQTLLIEFYLNQGMTEEALDCANKDVADVNLKNKCHVIHGLIKSSDLSALKEIEKEEFCEKLKNVFYAMQDSSDKVLAGRVALVIGKVKHNQTFVQKAYGSFENCTPYASLAGELECMHWMTLNSDLSVPANISKCILGMQTLYKALNILMRPINDMERDQREALLDFYGFHKSKKDGVLRVFPQQKPLALQIVYNLDTSKHVCSVKTADACKNIFRFLAERGFSWQSKLEMQLLRTLNSTQQHTILTRLDSRIRCIELEMHIRVGAEELERRGTIWDKELGSLKHVPFYSHCECILKDIFEESGRILFVSLQDGLIQNVLSVLRKPKNRYFHKAMESYMQSLTHNKSDHWKEYHLSRFLRLIFLHGVFGARLQIDPEKVLEQINETVKCEMLMSMKDKHKLEAVKAFGFEVHALDEDKQTSTISSICIRMLYSQKFLRDSNLVQAAIEFGTFCRELSHCDIDLLPCFSQLSCWLEFYLTMFFILSTLLLSKPNDKESPRIVLPESYRKHTLTFGYVFCDNDNELQKITKLKRDAKANEAAYLQTLPCMLTLLCGEEMNLFDLIFNCDNDSKARKDEKGVFAERLLVLCLVVFCNLRHKLKDAKEIEKKLAMKIFSLIRNRRKLRLSNNTLMPILRKWRKNDTNLFSDILYEILQKRETDNLDYLSGLCVHVKGHITAEKINDPTSFRKKNFMNKETYTVIGIPQKDKKDTSEPQSKDNRGTTSERNTNTGVDLSKAGKTVNECTVSVHENKTDTNTEEPRKIPESKEEAAKNVIVRCLKKIIFRKKYGKMIIHLKQFIAEKKDKAIEELFKEQRENTAMCGVCGVHYINSEECSEMETSLHGEQSNPTDQQTTENNKHFKRAEEIGSPSAASSGQEDSMLNENPFSLLLSNSTNVPEQEYAKDHLNGDAHRLKKMEYDDFRNKVCTEIYEVMRSVKRFIGIYNLRSAKDEVYEIYSTQIETLCSEHDDIELSIKLIIKDKDWTNIDIDSKVQALREIFLIVRDDVLKIAKDLKQKRKDEAGKELEEQNKKTPKRKKLRYKEKIVFSAS